MNIDTLLIIIEQCLMHVPLLLGAYITISLMKLPDLSIESAYVSGAIIGAYTVVATSALPATIQLPLILIASLAGGAVVGMTSSTLTQYAGLPHLLSSIITFGIFYGINQLIAGSYISLSAYNNPLVSSGIDRHPEFITFLIIAVVVALIICLFLKKQIGVACAIYGDNPYFFHHYGISVPYVFITGVVVSNAFAGLSGYLFAQSNGFADISMGFGKALLCITALILGKVIIRPKQPVTIAMPLIGCLAYFTLQQTLLKIGFNLKYFTTIQAIVTLFILISMYRNHIKQRIDHLGV